GERDAVGRARGGSHRSAVGDHGLGLRREREAFAQCREQLGRRGRNRPPLCSDREPLAVEANLEAIAKTNERIASQALAPFDALEKEAWPERGQLHECRDRRVEITCDVERRFQARFPDPNTKKPISEYSGDGFVSLKEASVGYDGS